MLVQAYTILMVVRESCARNRRCPQDGWKGHSVGLAQGHPYPESIWCPILMFLFPWEELQGAPVFQGLVR